MFQMPTSSAMMTRGLGFLASAAQAVPPAIKSAVNAVSTDSAYLMRLLRFMVVPFLSFVIWFLASGLLCLLMVRLVGCVWFSLVPPSGFVSSPWPSARRSRIRLHAIMTGHWRQHPCHDRATALAISDLAGKYAARIDSSAQG